MTLKKLIELKLFLLATLAPFYQLSAQDSFSNIHYEIAFSKISSMIENDNIAFKEAVFEVENAFFEGNLSKEYFEYSINITTNVARSINTETLINYDGQDLNKVRTHAALFKVMKDSVSLLVEEDTLISLPFIYDFDDVFGKEDWSNMFVSKLLATRTGNCHSLPYLYKILAEELGEKAYLALAPNHIYIKNYSQKTGWYNTELTSASFPIDAWLMASGYIHMDAIRNEVYMDTLSQQETLALTLVDLAKGYERKFGIQDGEFMLKAANRALEVNPNFINALLLKAETQKKLFEDKMLMKSIDDPNVLMEQDEQAKELFLEMQSNYVKIHQLGYRQMPEEMYLDWLKSLHLEKEKYQNKEIPVKE